MRKQKGTVYTMRKSLRSATGIALVISLLLSMVLFAGAAPSEQDLKVAVASDIHYRPPEALTPMAETHYLPGDPVFHHANTKGMLTYEADAVIDEFLAKTEASGVEFLLIPGDLSEDGFWEEHRGIAKKLRDFQARSGIQVFVLPGNHDIRTSDSRNRLNLSDFLDVYADLGYDKTLARHEGTASYTAELSGVYRLIAIDACVYRQDTSLITPDLFAWVEAQVLAAKNDGKKLVAMTHFNVLAHFGLEGFVSGLLCVDQNRTLATALADWGVKYIFTGHEHANDISHAVSQKGNKIFDIETGSLITYPNAWREVTFSAESFKLETKYVESIDTSLLPDGFSQAQIDLLKSDFQAYSLNYFRAGFKSYAQMIPGLTATLAEKLKVAEGTAGYAAIDAAVMAIADAANLPFYDSGTPETDSVAEIAKKAGITLLPSEYVNLLDLAGAMYAGHYAGNENYPMDSAEVRLFGSAVNAVLVSVLINMPTQAANALLTAIGLPAPGFSTDGATAMAARRIYRQNGAKVFTRELVKMLGEGIFSDWSTPDDLNVTLEPFDAKQDLRGRADKITDFTLIFDTVLRVFRMVYDAVIKIIF